MNHREIQNGCGNTNNGEEGEDKTFLMKQVKLQQEAKIALAQVSMLGLAQVSMLAGQKLAALLEGSIPNEAHV